MKSVWRIILVILTIFAVSVPSALAQDDNAETSATVTIDGSPILQALVQSLSDSFKEAAENETTFDIATNGPNAAFESFCAGLTDAVMATRYITDAEIAQCEASGVEFVETLLGFDGLVAVMTPNLGANPVTCLSLEQLDSTYGLVAEGTEGDILNFDPLGESIPLTVYSPNADTIAYNLLQSLLPSGEVRSDVTFYDDPAEIVNTIATENGIAVMTLADYNAITVGEVTTLRVGTIETGDCYAPVVSNIEVGTYQASRPVMLYASRTSMEANTALRDLLLYATNTENANLVADAGFSAPTQASFARNQNNILGPQVGRSFSRAASPVTISTTAEGVVNIGGDPVAIEIVDALTGDFTGTYTAATLNTELISTAAAWDALCAGEVDVIFGGDPTAEQLAACEAADISTFDVPVASQTILFAVAAKNEELPTCLTVENLATAFAAPIPEGEEIPTADDREIPNGATNWQDLDSNFPDLPLYVFLPARSSLEADWVFAAAGMPNSFSRSTRETNVGYVPTANRTPGLYLAASVANYDGGGLTILRWADYQRSEHRDDLRLLEVDAGNGCVAPDLATIGDGSYAFADTVTLHFSLQSMSNEVVGAFMWDALSESSLQALSALNLPVDHADELRAARDQVFSLIEDAIAQAASAQTTEEPTTEPTEEVTEEATEEPTEEATEEMTEEATEEDTEEMTEEATEEATEEPTTEPTAEPTTEPTSSN